MTTTGERSARFIGLVLASVGALWLALTGLCSVALAVNLWHRGDPLGGGPMRLDEAILMTLMFGLPVIIPSALIGTLIYSTGRRLRRMTTVHP